jgi:hypothetical protein
MKTVLSFDAPLHLRYAGQNVEKAGCSGRCSHATIKGSELRAGMYLYALIADGQEVDVKQMILTE